MEFFVYAREQLAVYIRQGSCCGSRISDVRSLNFHGQFRA